MTREEFDGWRSVTEASCFSWTEDPIKRLNNKGAMYYIGGEDGCYIDISKDGKVTVGTYEGAYPHIGEATFYVKGTRQLKDFNEAFEYAVKLGGKKFIVDMFGGDAPAQPYIPAEMKRAGTEFMEIMPGTADEAGMFFRADVDSGKLCIGYLRGDFGRSGDEFHHSWFEQNGARKTPEFQAEFQTVMESLRGSVLKDHKSCAAYCRAHADALLPSDSGLDRYGFKLETASRQYFIRCTPLNSDYFYVFVHDKAPARELAAQTEHQNGAVAPEELPSVIEKIRKSQKAPKPPLKATAKSRTKKKEDAEL